MNELAHTIPGCEWIGSGAFNHVYRLKQLVFKVPIPAPGGIRTPTDFLDVPTRSVHLWNLINSHLHPPAQLYNIGRYQGWTAPFIEGTEPSDEEISQALLEIYERTGRIVVDAFIPGNFIKNKEGQVICVDIGLALQLETREEEALERSQLSFNAWRQIKKEYDEEIFAKASGYLFNRSKTVETIKILLYLKNHRPDICDVRFVFKNKALCQEIVAAYDTGKVIELSQKRGLHLIKEFCARELSNYIKSRGNINERAEFKSSFTTKLFRDPKLTEEKVHFAHRMLHDINSVQTAEEIQDLLNRTLAFLDNHPSLVKTKSIGKKSDLSLTLLRCQAMMETSGYYQSFDRETVESFDE